MNPYLEETIYFDLVTSSASGAAADADVLPTAEVFEDATDTTVVALTVVKRASKTGNYRVGIPCTAANGFELNKSYNVVGTAVVGGNTGKDVLGRFQVRAVPLTAVVIATAVTDRFATIYTATATINANVVSFAANAITSAAFLIGSVTKTAAGFIEYLMFTEKWDRAKKVKDATTGVITGYDTDGTTPIGTRTFTEPAPTNESVGPLV
jgi:hypothetical protein